MHCVLPIPGTDDTSSFCFLGVLLFCSSFKSLSPLERSYQKDRFVLTRLYTHKQLLKWNSFFSFLKTVFFAVDKVTKARCFQLCHLSPGIFRTNPLWTTEVNCHSSPMQVLRVSVDDLALWLDLTPSLFLSITKDVVAV